MKEVKLTVLGPAPMIIASPDGGIFNDLFNYEWNNTGSSEDQMEIVVRKDI